MDDHPGVRSGLREWFRQHIPAFDVVEAASGEEAVACAAARPPDVVVIDVALPGIDGFETTRQLRSKRPKLPVIILTLHDIQEYRNEAVVAGANAYILKQLAPRDLLRVVKALVPEGLEKPQGRDG